MPERITEHHPLGFFLPSHARLLMLGSFPPDKKRWSMDFYYPNFINDMWRIMGLVFFGEKNHFIIPGKKAFNEPQIRSFCLESGIALGDTAVEIRRLKSNAADKHLQILTPWEPSAILPQIPCCHTIAVTGQKALDTLMDTLPIPQAPKTGESISFSHEGRKYNLFRMPSSSRAYPLSLEKKAACYRHMLHEAGLLFSG